MPHTKEYFIQLIQMIHKQLGTKTPNCLEQCNKRQLIDYTNKLLTDNNCIPFNSSEIIQELA